MKKLKIAQLVGVLLLLVGVIIRAGTGSADGMYLVIFGVLIYTISKVSAWIISDKD